MLYAGLDVHQNFCQAVVMRKNGKIVKQGRIGPTEKDIQEFFEDLDRVTVAFEASRNYEYYYDTLEGICKSVKMSHPYKTRLIAEAEIKTDKIDAKALANLLRSDLLPTSYVPPDNIRELRHLVRHRMALGRHRADLKNQIYAVLARRNMKYPGKDTFSKKGIEWLKDLKHPEIESYLKIFEIIVNEINEYEALIKMKGMEIEEIRLLVTIPGISWYSAMIILSEIGDINRFETEEKLYSYAGLVPKVHQSGEKCYYGGLTKKGSKNLRWILVENVRLHVGIAPDSKVTRFYHRIRKKKPGNVATIAAARKLLQAIYWMLKQRIEFEVRSARP